MQRFKKSYFIYRVMSAPTPAFLRLMSDLKAIQSDPPEVGIYFCLSFIVFFFLFPT